MSQPIQPAGNIPGLPLAHVLLAKNLQDMIIMQLETVYGPSQTPYAKFGIRHSITPDGYVVTAGVWERNTSKNTEWDKWKHLGRFVEATSSRGAVGALEELWAAHFLVHNRQRTPALALPAPLPFTTQAPPYTTTPQAIMSNSRMSGLPRENIAMVTNLKALIISQAQAASGPLSSGANKFDVLILKEGTVYLARAIVYRRDQIRSGCPYDKWTFIMDGTSEVGVMEALEDLWQKLQNSLSGLARGMQPGQSATFTGDGGFFSIV
ncbi:hypothetical protein OPT61_g10020 [Boeremia exigua]|uniref:Uncharacterized protein n=1 Tax=Boeremia exigua TaxID=749465 RepID=A0ACC2HSH3_9PLEO|nr:hypothetical protein OPT61_g10020 [Boeremia exigua]